MKTSASILRSLAWLGPVGAGALLTTGCGLADCENTLKQTLQSQDGKYVATAFVRNCGATAPFSAQVELRPAGKTMGTTGNVYRGIQSEDIALAWISPTHLVITSGCLEVRQHITNFNGIYIQRFPR